MTNDRNDITLAESSVSLRLAEIRRRCSQFYSEPDTLELSLEEPAEEAVGTNPYDLG